MIIPVFKTNWYGRVQQRYLKFYCDKIERCDSQHSVRQTHFIKNISKVVVTATDFFYLVLDNGSQEFYQTSSSLLNDLIDIFKAFQQLNPNLIVSQEIVQQDKQEKQEQENEEDQKDN